MVFTHAWGLRSDQWNYQVPALVEAGLRCVLYDRRGHGRSDRPAAGYDIEPMADDLAAVMDHFGLHDATLVAHSLGSKTAELIVGATLTVYPDAGHGLYASDHEASTPTCSHSSTVTAPRLDGHTTPRTNDDRAAVRRASIVGATQSRPGPS